MLKELDVPGIIDLAVTEPDFLEIFGETEDTINDWSEEIRNKVQDFSLRAATEVSERKAATQTGFKKLSLPSFNGNVLNYMEFKKRWHLEVVPERRPFAMELAALREALPPLAKAKVIAVTSMMEAWKLLDLDYGDVEEVRAKLKREVKSIKIKASSPPARILEVFNQVQLISAKIKACGSSILLEDSEYISLIGSLLPKDTMWHWLESQESGWKNFYSFLERSALIARKAVTHESIHTALGLDAEKPKCPSCNKNHSGKCNRVKTSAAVQSSDKATKTCPVCAGQPHKYKLKDGKEAVSKRVRDCPAFKSATEDVKQGMVKKLKSTHPVCSKCSSWTHNETQCTWWGQCTKYSQVHINEMCLLKKVFSCATSQGNNSCSLSIQDIPVAGYNYPACCLFDNGSEITLITHTFAKKSGLTHEDASYSISGIGSNSTVCNKGKLYNLPLVDSEGNKILVKAFGVEKILSEKVGRDNVEFDQG